MQPPAAEQMLVEGQQFAVWASFNDNVFHNIGSYIIKFVYLTRFGGNEDNYIGSVAATEVSTSECAEGN